MKITRSFEIACDADSAWRAMHDPVTIANVYGSLLRLIPEGKVPTQLENGTRMVVGLNALGILPLGRQAIVVADTRVLRGDTETRTMHDRGGPLSGPLAVLHGWHHQMSVTPLPGSAPGAGWSDTLEASGPFAWLFWPALFSTWKMREARIKRLSRSW
ncbi:MULTISPECIES: hypothetical protein [unclassified Leucobacter]|uniref:hypothetical protein n=1 Tax=unclassified Leucobacter TaxID=2621730 RepID=UPI00165D50AC|nr:MULTISPECIES: hypothetical protein [unclassified Leucobacter]MBC9926415.1 hypothetical protein [Leucobacter sp. cx-169]